VTKLPFANGLGFSFEGRMGVTSTSMSDSEALEISVVLPCLNESLTIGKCVAQIKDTFLANNIAGEIVVADNGSSDGSPEIAAALGACVVNERRKGYGAALRAGIKAARGKYVVMGDADCSYDFTDIPKFVTKLREGNDLVIGNRFRGGIKPGAMPPLHRYLGNPVLTGIGRLFFPNECGDFHCGLRAFTREAYERMRLRTTGMEFASEMIAKAVLQGMRITEVPTTLSPDERDRPPHLRSWRDGWRHLRFLLMYSPRWLFLYPGALLMALGLMVGAWLLPGPQRLGSITLDVHTLLYAAAAILIGFQAVLFAVFTKVFAMTSGLLPPDERWDRLFSLFTLEKGLLTGGLTLLGGIGVAGYSVLQWEGAHFGALQPVQLIRAVACALVLMVVGVQLGLSSFFLSILGTARR
jgi:glycosyltransferase involved in cell wall biosynthesis